MNVNPLKVPILLLQTEALSKRLPPQHRLHSIVQQQAKMLRTGHKGEEALEFPLSFLPDNQYHIFHNLRIYDGLGYFQIDKLLLTKKFMLILEVKNIYGTLAYDNMGQFIRIVEEKEEGFSNPVAQVQLQSIRLRRWLKQFHFPPIPIDTLVVHTDPRSIIKNVHNQDIITKKVVHKENLLSKVEEVSNVYKILCLTDIQMHELSTLLSSSHHPYKVDILNKYDITKDVLLTGVICPACAAIPMHRIHGKWQCLKCNCVKKDTHIQALKEYQLLIGDRITNKQAREFLQLDSAYVTKRLLNQTCVKQIGSTSGRRYELGFFS
ncbi:nuclease-related domain-containing protein [Lentibacillus daqui]|uniref:nuclease-related domain-containing protein n=1 Tax=Lentibacillus daqui TaxID=2911514 RepID=UPI0022B0931A|nr:nuclease-related domain-containing protein [Lentibacillus daqui]